MLHNQYTMTIPNKTASSYKAFLQICIGGIDICILHMVKKDTDTSFPFPLSLKFYDPSFLLNMRIILYRM